MWITWFRRLTSPDLLNSEYFIAVIAQLPYSCEQVYFEVISLKTHLGLAKRNAK